MSVSKDDEDERTLESNQTNQADDLWCDDDVLLSQAYDVYLTQSKSKVRNVALPTSATKEDAACSSHVEKVSTKGNQLGPVGDKPGESESNAACSSHLDKKRKRGCAGTKENQLGHVSEKLQGSESNSSCPSHLDKVSTGGTKGNQPSPVGDKPGETKSNADCPSHLDKLSTAGTKGNQPSPVGDKSGESESNAACSSHVKKKRKRGCTRTKGNQLGPVGEKLRESESNAAYSSHVEKKRKRGCTRTKGNQLGPVGEKLRESESIKQSTEEKERIEKSEDESLFGGDFSDDDPSYLPHDLDCTVASESEDSDLMQLDELLNPDVYLTKAEKKKAMRRKGIDLVFGKPKELNNNESLLVAEELTADIFKRTWKIIQPCARWSQRDPATWKKNLAKTRRAEGLPYVTKKKIRGPKVPQPIDCSKCKFECNTNFDENFRENVCRKYWNLDYVSKKQFILSLIDIKPIKRVLLVRTRSTPRNHTKQCNFINEGEKKNVCQDFFCRTLCISSYVLTDAVKHRDSLGQYSKEQDPRGRREPPNKTQPEVFEAVKKHIQSFPSMESHYVRKKLKRKYLETGLTLSKMYSLYVEDCKSKNSEPAVSEMTYRRIFCTEFNLGFFMPKKDQCLLCTKFKRANNEEERNKIQKEYDEHVQRKKTCNLEKQKDKQRAEKEADFLTVSFDLQAILQIPSTDVGLLYYTRKLTLYNLTIYENAIPNEAYCFVWNEVHGKKGSAEIGTILHHYLTTCVPKEIKEVSLYSDTCGGQNRNQNIAAILLWIMNQEDTHLNVIEHKFLESGHSYMEADSMHSAIENTKKNCDIYCMSDWINVFKRARSKKVYKHDGKKVTKNPYHVKEFKFNDFKDLKAVADEVILNRNLNTDNEKVNWLKIKRMKYLKGDTKIYYNNDMSNEFMTLDVTATTTKKDKITTNPSTSYPNHGYGTRKKRNQEQDLKRNQEQDLKRNQEQDLKRNQEQDFSELSLQPISTRVIFAPLQQLYSRPLPITVAKKRTLQICALKG